MSDYFYPKDGRKNYPKLMELNQDLFTSFMAFNQKVFAEGTLSVKMKELVARQPFASLEVQEFYLEKTPKTHGYLYRGIASK